MKRSDIRNAYDRMSPTSQQKDAMYQNLMKAGANRGGMYYAKSRETNKWSWIPAAAAVILIAVLGVFVLGRSTDEDNVLSPAIIETNEQAIAPHEAMLTVYRIALAEGWTGEQCIENGISARFGDTEYAKENAAYALMDLDGNGIEELIIGHGMSHYFYVWDLFTFEDDQPVQLHTDLQDHTNCHLYKNGIIGHEYTSKTEGAYCFYKLEGTTLVATDILTCTEDVWYDEMAKQQVSAEEATSRLNRFEMLDIQTTSLLDYSGEIVADTETTEQYMLILEKYKTALLENWTWVQCDEAGISPQIMYSWVIKNDLGWCIIDLDGNGKSELIISDGTYLFDLYTLEDQPKQILSAHSERYSLCKDGTIEKLENVEEVNTYWRWFTLKNTILVQQDMLFYEGESHTYSYGKIDSGLQPISENEAGQYITNLDKSPMELTLTPFVEKEFTVVAESNFYYESIIETYRTAITEHWNPEKCIEYGISLMVGYYGGIVPELGHNQIDLNGDGSDELIITDGMNIYDLYTIVNDEEVGPLRLIDATERNQFYLTTDGQIYNMASGSAMLCYYYLFDIGQKELVFDKGLKFDASVDQNNPWHYYEESMDKAAPCTAEDARVIMDAIHFMDIAFVPFVSQSSPAATDTLQQHVKVVDQSDYDYAEYIAWLRDWREKAFENPLPLYYCWYDCNCDGYTDLVLGYEDSVQSVWSYMYDKASKTEHLTLLILSDAEYTELDKVWLTMDIRNINDFELN